MPAPLSTAPESGFVRVSAPADHAAVPPVDRRRVLRWAALVAALLVVAVIGFALFAARQLAESEAVHEASRTADVLAEAVVEPEVTDALVAGDPAAVAALDEVVRSRVLGDTVVRVKLWDSSGRIVYSDEPRLIGQVFELEEEDLEALDDASGASSEADVTDLREAENRYERDRGKLLEAYRSIVTPSGQPLLFEAYSRYDSVDRRTDQLFGGFAAVTLGSILLLGALLAPVAWWLASLLGRLRAQRETLLQHALDASAAERRRIAGTLHDGVVQDLAATSFALAASTERASALGDDALADRLGAVAATVRGSIGGLRSLLVDIYPPSLASAGIAAALEDLATGLRARGVVVEVETTGMNAGQPAVLDPETERLLFRVAQETLANAARHARAGTVVVRLDVTATVVELDIADDGVGFDVEERMQHPEEGHFGLRVLGDVASAAGAELFVASAPGAGTTWRLRAVRR